MEQIDQFFERAVVPYQSMLRGYFKQTHDLQTTLTFGILLQNKGFLLNFAGQLHKGVVDKISALTGKSYAYVLSDVSSHASTFQMFIGRAKLFQNIDDIIRQNNLTERLNVEAFARIFNTGRTVARGGQAKISHHYWGEKNLQVAVKKFSQLRGNPKQAANAHRNELFYLFRLSGITHFLNVYAYVQEDDSMYVVMEWMDRGSLDDLINDMKNGFEITFAILLKIVYGILCAGATLASLGIVHADIKPQNFLLNECFDVKLADFGAACENGGQGTLYTPGYVAPEFHDTQATADHKWDCFSVGKTLNDLVFFHPLMSTLRSKDLLEINDIIDRMMSRNPNLRMTCEEAISTLVETSFNMEAIDRMLLETFRQRPTSSRTGLSIGTRASQTISTNKYGGIGDYSKDSNADKASGGLAAVETVSVIGYNALIGATNDRTNPRALAADETVSVIGYNPLIGAPNDLTNPSPPKTSAERDKETPGGLVAIASKDRTPSNQH
ncbi:NUAK SNF1-like kinase 1, partial [Quaeritorhiza haematococci]